MKKTVILLIVLLTLGLTGCSGNIKIGSQVNYTPATEEKYYHFLKDYTHMSIYQSALQAEDAFHAIHGNKSVFLYHTTNHRNADKPLAEVYIKYDDITIIKQYYTTDIGEVPLYFAVFNYIKDAYKMVEDPETYFDKLTQNSDEFNFKDINNDDWQLNPTLFMWQKEIGKDDGSGGYFAKIEGQTVFYEQKYENKYFTKVESEISFISGAGQINNGEQNYLDYSFKKSIQINQQLDLYKSTSGAEGDDPIGIDYFPKTVKGITLNAFSSDLDKEFSWNYEVDRGTKFVDVMRSGILVEQSMDSDYIGQFKLSYKLNADFIKSIFKNEEVIWNFTLTHNGIG